MSKSREEIDPYFIYGTAWKEESTEKLTQLALQSGFRAVDTANQRKHYFEEGVGKGIANFLESQDYQRDDLFVQSKYTYQKGQDHRLPYDPKADYSQQVKQSFQSSLDHLQTDYLDSYILHGPSTRKGLNDKDYEVWKAMEDLHNDGLTKYIGVSNINAHQLQLLIENVEIIPKFVQNRCFARSAWDKSVRNICDQHDIIYQGFSLLTANQKYLAQPEIREIANKYEIPNTAVIFTFATQIGLLPLTGTTDEDHMVEDLMAIEKQLTSEEVQVIENIAV